MFAISLKAITLFLVFIAALTPAKGMYFHEENRSDDKLNRVGDGRETGQGAQSYYGNGERSDGLSDNDDSSQAASPRYPTHSIPPLNFEGPSQATKRFFSQSNKKAASTRLHLAPNGIIDTDSYHSRTLISLAGGGPPDPKGSDRRTTIVALPFQENPPPSLKEPLQRAIFDLNEEATYLSKKIQILDENITINDNLTTAIEEILLKNEQKNTSDDAVELNPEGEQFILDLTNTLSDTYEKRLVRTEEKVILKEQNNLATFLISLLQASSKEEALTILQQEKQKITDRDENEIKHIEVENFFTIDAANITALIAHFNNPESDLNQCKNALLADISNRYEAVIERQTRIPISIQNEVQLETNALTHVLTDVLKAQEKKFQRTGTHILESKAQGHAADNTVQPETHNLKEQIRSSQPPGTALLEALEKAEKQKTVAEKSWEIFSAISSFFK